MFVFGLKRSFTFTNVEILKGNEINTTYLSIWSDKVGACFFFLVVLKKF